MEIKEITNYNEISLDEAFSILQEKENKAASASSLYEQTSTEKISQEKFNELFFELLGNEVIDESKRKNKNDPS